MPLGALLDDRLHIGGQWQRSSNAAVLDVFDPASGEVIGRVADGTVEDASSSVDAAAAALPGWAATPPRERSEVLRRAYELMITRREAFATLIVAESGKALVDARGEVTYAAEFFRWYAEEACRLTGSLSLAPGGAHRVLVSHQPVGVALLITPWNFPAAMVTRKIGPALAAGCTAVLKPAEETPLTALALVELLIEAGLPPGVVNVVPTSDPVAVVGRILGDPRVRKLSFTGSTAVGRSLLRSASESVLNCSMELGGNAPFVVLEDADVNGAVADAMVAKMRNGGQACTSANRFLVHRSVVDAFTDRLTRAMEVLTVGPGLDSDVGPLITSTARTRVAGLVDDAVGQGATIRTGGMVPSGPGWFYPPTVLADVPRDAGIVHQEVFGPVAPVQVFDDEADAVTMANDTEYGLVAYVQSRDLARALAFADRLEFGMVGVNRGVVSEPAAPFGGMKQSGLGREGGHEGVLEYCETKYIAAGW